MLPIYHELYELFHAPLSFNDTKSLKEFCRTKDQSLVLFFLKGWQHRPKRTPGPHSFGSGDGRCQPQHPGTGEAGRSHQWHQDRGAGRRVRNLPSTQSVGGNRRRNVGLRKQSQTVCAWTVIMRNTARSWMTKVNAEVLKTVNPTFPPSTSLLRVTPQ